MHGPKNRRGPVPNPGVLEAEVQPAQPQTLHPATEMPSLMFLGEEVGLTGGAEEVESALPGASASVLIIEKPPGEETAQGRRPFVIIGVPGMETDQGRRPFVVIDGPGEETDRGRRKLVIIGAPGEETDQDRRKLLMIGALGKEAETRCRQFMTIDIFRPAEKSVI